jgi:broad specificity phosphatase PhoE
MKIILARHGKPNLEHWAWISPGQMKDWIDTYNQADVLLSEIPTDTMEVTTSSSLIVCSTLRRCLQSAERLDPSRTFLSESVFCEADLPYPLWRFPKLPLSIWGVVLRLAWFCGFSANAESFAEATIRAREATERLIALAKENCSVILVGHGIMTMLIAKQLLAQGWVGPKYPINKYWQFTVYNFSA